MVITKRLNITLLSDEAMEEMIYGEAIPELKQAYTEMMKGCKACTDRRQWYGIWDICLADALDISIGNLSFKGLNDDGIVEIGYGINEEYAGNGYATEAVSAMVSWALSQPGVFRIEAETEPDNLASQRVLAKSGFIPNGIIGEEGPRFEIRKI